MKTVWRCYGDNGERRYRSTPTRNEGEVLTMVSGNESEMIVGLDIGTSKVVAIVGAISPDGMMEIVGTGMHRSTGMKKGVVVNIESTVLAIQRAVKRLN